MVDEFPEMQISSLKLQHSLQGLQAKTWLMLNTEQAIQLVLMSDVCWDMMRPRVLLLHDF